jgi:ATP-dependent helicase/nuclease subunit A
VELTASQLAAVEALPVERDTCVVAGPGSGKTTVLVEHFERLVASGKDPLRILAITFTDKAANNMRERLARTFQDRPEIRGKLERAYVSTVHGFCARLLKENAIFAGVDPGFYVMDERESLRLEREAVDTVLDAMFAAQPERMRALMRGLAAMDAGRALLEAYEAIRAAGAGIGELSRFPAPQPGDVARALQQLQNARPWDWTFKQRAHLAEVQASAAALAAALGREPQEQLRAIARFNCNLTSLRKNNATYDLVKSLKNEWLPELEYSLITQYYAAERATLFEILARFDRLYRERKLQLGGLDYDDLEEYAVRLLRDHAEVRRHVHAQFDRVLMDEFQDTNGQQAKLLELLRRPDGFYAVGDINQSIYGFRHAEPEVFRAYRDQVSRDGKRVIELLENFRSRPEILRAVDAVLRGAPGIEPRPLVAGSKFADKREPSVEAVSAVAADMEAALALEARWVARRIGELAGHGAEFRDFSVLVRNSEVFPEFTRAFEAAGIPHLVSRGKGFYETREVVDLMHLLRVIVNPRDEISMAAVLRSPFVGASDEVLLRLREEGNIGAAIGRCGLEWLARLRALRDSVSIDQLLLRAIDECGYPYVPGTRGGANIEKFLAQARLAGARQTLAEFVEDLAILRASKPREPDAPPEDSANAVKLMTVHAAKGLEFPVVFLAALHKGVESGPGGIEFLPGIGLGARWNHPVIAGKDKDDAFQHRIRQRLARREEEESHRLLYVAMTRAKEHLVLSFSSNGKAPQNWAALVARSLPVQVVDAIPEQAVRAAPVEAAAAVQICERPKLTGQYEAEASATSIALFAECPRRYYLSRYLGVDESRAGSRGVGRQVHAILAGMPVEHPHPEAVRLAEVFRTSPLGRRAAAASVAEREFDCIMEMEDLVIRGQIDLWFEERGETVLVDYKTEGEPSERYALQVRLYARALERLRGRAPAEAYVCFLRPNLAVPVELHDSLFDSPELRVREFREAQETMHYPLQAGAHCRTCPHFLGLCPANPAILPNP